MSVKPRVRLAPSPTGDPHVGTAYIALFNYVFAKSQGGEFLLRIEDTDQKRARKNAEMQIIDCLKWLGLHWDEGPDVGGAKGPYRQSERLSLYQEAIDQLSKEHKAYPCFCTPERLEKVRAEQREKGIHSGYDRHCRNLSREEVAKNRSQGLKEVVRMKVPEEGVIRFQDRLRGEVKIDSRQLDDQVILKADGFPTYHLANVVDDHHMGITHVIRAEEWISSTPKHVLLYEAFGWSLPEFIHLPLLRNKDKSKISKRKNPVSLSYYRRAGILPAAMINFLALMGWSYGDDREKFTLKEMMEVFSIDRISLGGPIFDQEKLSWLNQAYIAELSPKEFAQIVQSELFSTQYLEKLAPLLRERLPRLENFVDKAQFFFNGALDYSGSSLVPKGKTGQEIASMLDELSDRLDLLDDWDESTLDATLKAHKDQLGFKPKDYFMTVRLVVTGRKDSPPLTETLVVLGPDMVKFRIRDVLLRRRELLPES